MIVPNTKRHPNNTKTDQLPILRQLPAFQGRTITKAHVGKMDAILIDSLKLKSRIKICILTNVIVPKVEYADIWEGSAKLLKQLETVHR